MRGHVPGDGVSEERPNLDLDDERDFDSPGAAVRLDTRRLTAAMTDRSWTALQLHVAAGEPSKRTINRWLRAGARSRDGMATAQWGAVRAVAEALGVPASDLIDPASANPELELDRFFLAAAALGPQIHPGALARLGLAAQLESGEAAAHVTRTHTGLRFARWALCESLLDGGACLPEHALAPLQTWLSTEGPSPSEAPEIHCLVALHVGDSRRAQEHGLHWMRQAAARGAVGEVRWVGRRLLAACSPLEPVTPTRCNIALLCARALRQSGKAQDAMGLLSELLLPMPAGPGTSDRARVHLELARLRYHCGDEARGLMEVHAAVACLDGLGPSPQIEPLRFEALLERLSLQQALSDPAGAAETLVMLHELTAQVPGAALSRFCRLQGISALDRGAVRDALDLFREAADVAAARDDRRDLELARLNMALCHALRGSIESARAYLSEVEEFLTGAEGDAFSMAITQLNFGELELDADRPEAALDRLEVALGDFERAGEYPALVSRVYQVRALALASLSRWERAHQEARTAFRHAVEAGSVVDRALALAVCAYTGPASPDPVTGLVDEARTLLAGLPPGSQVVARLDVDRISAAALIRAGEVPAGVAIAARVQWEASRLGLDALARRAARQAATAPP